MSVFPHAAANQNAYHQRQSVAKTYVEKSAKKYRIPFDSGSQDNLVNNK